MRKRRLLAVALLLGLGWGTGPSSAADSRVTHLAPKYREWLLDVALLLHKEEREAFLALKEDYQRDGFIQKFWVSRDPYPETPENEFKGAWYARLDQARKDYDNITEDRARTLLLHGVPSKTWKTDCQLALWPLEIWYYHREERLPAGFFIIFVEPAASGPYRLWNPIEGDDALQALFRNSGEDQNGGVALKPPDRRKAFQDMANVGTTAFERIIDRLCRGDDKIVLTAYRAVLQESVLGTFTFTEYPPPPKDTEWLATFLGLSTDLPPTAPAFSAQLTIGFPERRGDRTLVQGVLQIPRTAITASQVEGQHAYNLLLTGEVLKDEVLHESFRYRYDLPDPGPGKTQGETVPLVFERTLRPGEYTLVVRLDDLTGKRSFRESRSLLVPMATTTRPEPGVAAALQAARQSLAEPERETGALRLIPPPGETATGGVRVEAKVNGAAIRKVSFALDGKALLTKTAPPYSVDLALGKLPTPHTVRAVGLDDADKEVAVDELVLNGAPQRFAVRLREPRRGERFAKAAGETLRIQAEVQVPDGQTLERLEISLDERRVATLYQPPFSTALLLPSPAPRYVRALALLTDGSTAEDLVLLNTPGYQEHVDVPLVEVYAAVKDGQARPVLDLQPADFRVLDGGVPQQVVRWERVTDLPVSVALLIDTSASMVKSLPEAQRAALGFLRSTLSPRDRAALIPFSESPRLAVKLSNDLPTLAGALAGLQAERGTALWDSLVFGLHYLQGLGGVRGQRALLLLTDGGDRSSRFSFDEALEFARRSGVALYTVGLAVGTLEVEVRRHLTRLAEETGGRSFFPNSASDLAGIYARIQEELRSRYLLVYQPAVPGKPGEYRTVAVQVDRPGVTVEAIRGYYP
ncbi:MAG TPA: VWA domain-containing protein [Thermoanaerobaculia bacterium]|nr:VWA domain-containing protein [Thermoanaerobaculia bacterium]